MPPNLPTELLRTFVAIVDAGTLQKATERIFLTQSALSLQIKRLEDLLQTPLFLREGRRLTLAPAGVTLLGFARKILEMNEQAVSAVTSGAFAGPVRVGMVQDMTDTLLTGVLASYAQIHPQAQLHARIAGTAELLDLLGSDRLDVVAGFGPAGDPNGVLTVPVRWMGNPELLGADVLPLAVLETPCRFREAALSALDRIGRPYRIVVETPNLSSLRAAVRAGLGLTCRAMAFDPLPPLPLGVLPPLAPVSVTLAHRANPSESIGSLIALVRQAIVAQGAGDDDDEEDEPRANAA
ncbi:LysR substrate-binding domain-containing protein [Azospirillum sp. B4]|uniref:LysR substrate-binding domain-containing protein n=1 Tax=Azospirillum sp. B4 TaxID=95605 RepID=UPI000344F674|nr:LysR substrate-binding domain-containing protein [Azospirillum sp. B4]